MKLQILIPHYTEPENFLVRLLDSIDNQQGIDVAENVGVIICNDGRDVILPVEEWREKYSFDIRYCIREHAGVSATRNHLLSLATADYIMCCDCDDMFSSMIGIFKILEMIENAGFDMFYSAFYEEVSKGEKKYEYIERQFDPFFVHGKVFNRRFLLDNDIHWHESLHYSGDNYFLWQAIKLSKSAQYCTVPFYIWKCNMGSVCRLEKEHFVKSYYMSVRSDALTIENFLERQMYTDAALFFYKLMFETYFKMNSIGWKRCEDKERKRKALLEFSKCYGKYKDEFSDTLMSVKQKALQFTAKTQGMKETPAKLQDDIDLWAETLTTAFIEPAI